MANTTELLDIFSTVMKEINESGQSDILKGSIGSIKDLQSVLMEQDKLIDKTLRAGNEQVAMRIIKRAKEAKDAGADIVGSDEFIEKIKSGELDFEKLICTPGMMVKLSKLGKVLGPKGLMPNPKLGSVSDNIKQAVTDAKSGQAEIRNDKDGNIGVSIGKKSFHDDQLLKNYQAILDTLEKEKGNLTLKGDLIKNAFVTSSMGVSYKVKLGKAI